MFTLMFVIFIDNCMACVHDFDVGEYIQDHSNHKGSLILVMVQKFCTTRDGPKNPGNNGISSTWYQPQLVSRISSINIHRTSMNEPFPFREP